MIAKIAVITALGRPEQEPRIRRCVNNQTLNCRLYIGRGPTAAMARNRAMDKAYQEGCSYWVTMDDDDFYGPTYVEKMIAALSKGGLCHQRCRWCLYDDGLYYFDARSAVVGGAMAGDWEPAPRFAENKVVGEDAQLYKEYRDKGRHVVAMDGGFVYNRKGRDHVCRPQKHLMIASYGGALRYDGSELDSVLYDMPLKSTATVVGPSTDAEIVAELKEIFT